MTQKERERVERWGLTVTLGVIAANVAIAEAQTRPRPSDFGQVWAAARFLLEGVNPYDAIGPHGTFTFQFPLFYPLTAAVAAVPVAPLPAAWADAVFMGIGTAALAWALTRHTTRNPQLLVFTSFAFLTAMGNVQWSPILTAAALLPPLGFLLACKPTLAVALMAAYPSRVAILSAAGFGAITTVLWPWWIGSWLATLPAGTHFVAPVMLWGGPLVLLALLKWRRPEARLLVAMACIPHTPVLYETVPLFLVVQRWYEGALLAMVTPLVWYLQDHYGGPYPSYDAWTIARAQWQVWLMYLPCVVMVLRRPNTATASE